MMRGARLRIMVVAITAVAGIAAGLGAAAVAGFGGGETKQIAIAVDPGCSTASDPNCKLRQAIHVHADFALFVDGKQWDFSSQLSTKDVELHPYVHFHPPRTTVLHVHRSGTTWDEALRALGFTLNDPSMLEGTPADATTLTLPDGTKLTTANGKTFKFWLNGVRADGIGRIEIGDLDRLLVSYGSETEDQVRDQQLPKLTDQACIPSGLCKSRVPAGEPPEYCSGQGACGK